MKNNLKKGFTLIELLVVIAIIGILASVVLASLNSARNKSVDVAIKATLANSRAQAALFYDTGQIYENVCIDPTGIAGMILSAAEKLNSAAPSVGIDTDGFVYDAAGGLNSAVCHDEDTAWAAIVSLKNPTLPVGGPDATGASQESTSLDAGVTACP